MKDLYLVQIVYNYLINKFNKLVLYLLSLTLRIVLPIKKGRVLLWATNGKDYGCNPMYISKYLVNKEEMFDVWWMFIKDANIGKLDEGEHSIWFGSLKYLYILNTAEFLITNHRTIPLDLLWKKRKGQKYIMTWHGSMPIKKVEKDAMESVGPEYVNNAIADSKICDLMISDSAFFTNLVRKSFWYEGEILKTTIPRNQKFYEIESHKAIRNKVISYFKEAVDQDYFIVLYAPTFRSDNSVSAYITEWGEIKTLIELKYGKKVIILMRLHPNLLQVIDTETLIKDNYVKNASKYNDMQELMVASDLLITDYSSTMFEFSMMRKPTYLYLPDMETYDREFYFNFVDLPFAQSKSIPELLGNIENCASKSYPEKLYDFVNSNFGLYEGCNGSAKVCDWMKQHKI